MVNFIVTENSKTAVKAIPTPLKPGNVRVHLHHKSRKLYFDLNPNQAQTLCSQIRNAARTTIPRNQGVTVEPKP